MNSKISRVKRSKMREIKIEIGYKSKIGRERRFCEPERDIRILKYRV